MKSIQILDITFRRGKNVRKRISFEDSKKKELGGRSSIYAHFFYPYNTYSGLSVSRTS